MRILLSLFLIAAGSFCAFGQPSECFPFEKLSPEKRKTAEELLLKALDSEALYTIAGDLKPMSSGFASFEFATREVRGISETEAGQLVSKYPDEASRRDLTKEEKSRVTLADNYMKRRNALAKMDETREILGHFRCGDRLYADVYHFSRAFEGKRFAEAVVFNRPALRDKINEKSVFFARFGVTANSHPLQALFAVEYDQTGARFGGYGYLFGYPDYAVSFFVNAADEEEFTGKFVERDFLSIPTFSSPTNRFVYAVPKGHAENDADRALKEKALKIFEEYKKRRAEYIGEGKKGPAQMMRDWLGNRTSQLSSIAVRINIADGESSDPESHRRGPAGERAR